MKVDYIANILNEFDNAFSDILAGRSTKGDDMFNDIIKSNGVLLDFSDEHADIVTMPTEGNNNDLNELLSVLEKIYTTANKISAERYMSGFNSEIALANLLNIILSGTNASTDAEDNFFELLSDERKVSLPDALSEFDFYNNNPYKAKAEKILSKIEAKKNRA